MPSKVLLATLAADVVFLATGCIQLVFSLVRGQKDAAPRDGEQAVRNLLSQHFPLATAFLTLAGLYLSTRRWLKLSGYIITFCAVFSLCIGVDLWLMTLRLKDGFYATYLVQDSDLQEMMQTAVRFLRPYGAVIQCCGYYNYTAPAFVTNIVCPSPAAGGLIRGCAPAISSFSNAYIDGIFTSVFGMIGVDFILILAIACLLKDRKERERYRLIDEKSDYPNY